MTTAASTSATTTSALEGGDLATRFPRLHAAAFNTPAIDNHAHPLLREECRDSIPFEGLISEAEGEALLHDALHTMACFRATAQLAEFFGLKDEEIDGEVKQAEPTWDDVKKHRAGMAYDELCRRSFQAAGIECLLIDDGLGGVKERAEPYQWHDHLTPGKTKRIVRVEIEAEAILRDLLEPLGTLSLDETDGILQKFEDNLRASLMKSAEHPDVVGFKSIVCYRTGMNVSVNDADPAESKAALLFYKSAGTWRLAEKPINDLVVRIALEVAGKAGIPVQFHTGLGDSDITLALSSPAHLQPIIKKFKNTTFVLLHSSYPYTRDAGYLTAVYPNVYLDFGEVFPFVSGDGQRSIIRQVLELSPTNKIMWSSDGHWWPESFYLGAYQARQALFEVLAEKVGRKELTENIAVKVVENALYANAKRLYRL